MIVDGPDGSLVLDSSGSSYSGGVEGLRFAPRMTKELPAGSSLLVRQSR